MSRTKKSTEETLIEHFMTAPLQEVERLLGTARTIVSTRQPSKPAAQRKTRSDAGTKRKPDIESEVFTA